MKNDRFILIEGNHPGGSDDVAGRWYIVDTDWDIIDKRGRGYATKKEARAMLRRISGVSYNDMTHTACTYIVATSDPSVDRECGKPAVASVTPGKLTVYLCRQHERRVRRMGLAEVTPLG